MEASYDGEGSWCRLVRRCAMRDASDQAFAELVRETCDKAAPLFRALDILEEAVNSRLWRVVCEVLEAGHADDADVERARSVRHGNV